jgi:SAM-dependent methyltransferase
MAVHGSLNPGVWAMIIHQLIAQHLRNKDDAAFYLLQARDALQWIEKYGGPLKPGQTVLDLGCGHGIFGAEWQKKGCDVVFADETDYLNLALKPVRFLQINLDRDPIQKLGQYDLVLCSNVFEHLAAPDAFIEHASEILKPGGRLYLSWTNWLSPWGGHEFSPYHYLGAKRGPQLYDSVTGRKRIHTPHVNLFPTYIGCTLKKIRAQKQLRLIKAAPRYYPEFSFLLHLPVLREFLTWNCALLLEKV